MKKTSLSLCVIGILLSGCGTLPSLFKSDNGGSGGNNNCEKHIEFWGKCAVEQTTDKWTCSELSNLSVDSDTTLREGIDTISKCISAMYSSSDFDYEFLRACAEKAPDNYWEIYNATFDKEMRSQCPNLESSDIRTVGPSDIRTGGSGTPSLPAGTTTQNCQNLLNRSVLTPFRSCIERTARQITCNNWESQLITAGSDCTQTVDSMTFMMNCPGILHAPHLRRIVASKEAEFRAKCD